MAELYGTHFEFDGISSRDYNLVFATVDAERMGNVYGQISGVTFFNRSDKARHLLDNDYSDFPLSFEIEIVTECGAAIPNRRRREIEKWLFNRSAYKELFFDTTDDVRGETYEYVDGEMKRLYMNCRFVNPEKLEYNNGVVGYRATLESDSGLLWQEEIQKTFEFDNHEINSQQDITISLDTDLDDYTYPQIRFTTGGNESSVRIIVNDDSDKTTVFTDLPANTTVTMIGGINAISAFTTGGGGEMPIEVYNTHFARRNFVRLVDGDNAITIRGDVANIIFTYQNRRML